MNLNFKKGRPNSAFQPDRTIAPACPAYRTGSRQASTGFSNVISGSATFRHSRPKCLGLALFSKDIDITILFDNLVSTYGR